MTIHIIYIQLYIYIYIHKMLGNHPFEDVISNNIIVVSDSILSSNILR
jgi:hypothetical protein